MNTTNKVLGVAILGVGLLIGGCGKKQTLLWQSLKNPEVAAQLKSFVVEKEAQAKKAATNASPPGFAPFFAAAERGDWLAVSNMFQNFRNHSARYEHFGKTDDRLRGPAWEVVEEVWGAFDAFGEGEGKYSAALGRDIIESIPPGSIYFGGTDPGRFIVTALQKSQVNGDPFFTLTQNALADGSYLQYLRSMYDGKIYTPTDEDSQRCFNDYMQGAQQRKQNHQLKPGEDVKVTEGRVQISGQVAVMSINGLIAKTIFDKNPDREFYVEESVPLDWMYPYLEPHGLIMKINRQPLTELSDEVVQNDHDYWMKYTTPMIGGWLNSDTPVEKVAAFAEKIFVKKDLNGFTGDPQFVQSDYSCKIFSKLRSSIAGVYAWRAQHATNAAEKQRMNDAADFAFRQALALCPSSPEAVFRYVQLLTDQNRFVDAIFIADTAAKLSTDQVAKQFRDLADNLKKAQKRK